MSIGAALTPLRRPILIAIQKRQLAIWLLGAFKCKTQWDGEEKKSSSLCAQSPSQSLRYICMVQNRAAAIVCSLINKPFALFFPISDLPKRRWTPQIIISKCRKTQWIWQFPATTTSSCTAYPHATALTSAVCELKKQRMKTHYNKFTTSRTR